MTESIPRRQICGFLFVSIFGTFLHFLFDLTGGNILAGLFSPVNESIWEHLKLLFYPMVLVALWQYFRWGHHLPDFWCVKTMGILLGLLLIPVLYYSYSGVWGVNIDLVNIAIFFLVAAIAYYWETRRFRSGKVCKCPGWVWIILLIIISLLFTIFTLYPPKIPLFQDPMTNSYGIFGM